MKSNKDRTKTEQNWNESIGFHYQTRWEPFCHLHTNGENSHYDILYMYKICLFLKWFKNFVTIQNN